MQHGAVGPFPPNLEAILKILISVLGSAALLAGCSSAPSYSPSCGPQCGAQYQPQSQPQYANAARSQSKFAVGLGAGTTGATLEAKFAPNNNLALRGSYNFLEFGADQDYDGIDYEGDLSLNTFGGFVDVAPFGNGFVLSGGAYIGDKTLDLFATPSNNVEIGGQTFTPAEVGSLNGQAELKNFAPYAGIGYDSFIAGSSDWSFNARAGVMFTGSPKVDLVSVDGLLSDDATLRAELNTEIASIEEEAEDYKYYPVLSVGIARRF